MPASSQDSSSFAALIDYEDEYVQPLILSALASRLSPDSYKLVSSISDHELGPLLQWRQYEAIDFERRPQSTSLANSFVIRKALTRKHFLSSTVAHFTAKHPSSCLNSHFKPAHGFELDYAEFLDDALVDAFELRASLKANVDRVPGDREWWILKPSMSDRGQGIRLFGTEEELQAIFDRWEDEKSDSEDDGDDDDDHERNANAGDVDADAAATLLDRVQIVREDGNGRSKDEPKDYVVTSHLRHFVAQPYINPPLLLPPPHPLAGHKFHIRVYVLAVGALSVYVHKPMLALFAAKSYEPPRASDDGGEASDLGAHLTNTCLQTRDGNDVVREAVVRHFWSLPSSIAGLDDSWRGTVLEQIKSTTADLFRAALAQPTFFQPLPNAFEIFGLDFLVDAKGTAWLLEVNAFPDFAQSGQDLKEDVVKALFEDVVEVAVAPFFRVNLRGRHDGTEGEERATEEEQRTGRLIKVLDVELGLGMR